MISAQSRRSLVPSSTVSVTSMSYPLNRSFKVTPDFWKVARFLVVQSDEGQIRIGADLAAAVTDERGSTAGERE